MSYQQAPPYCVQIELTEGCPLRCPFCGLNGIRTKKANAYRYMSEATATRIAEGMALLGWNSRLEFAMHGEPTVHPSLGTMLTIFRKHLSRSYMLMESNGYGLSADTELRVAALFATGLTTLAIDEYQGVAWAAKIRENTKQLGDKIHIFEYPADGPAGNPHQRSAAQRLIFVAPIDLAASGTHATLNNHCGSGAPLNDKAQGKRCAKPFRELSFRYDGSVAVCCNDWRGELPIGNINNVGLTGLWHHPRMEAVRRHLYHGQRTLRPCLGCDATSYRPGLLPDAKGKETLPKPTAKDIATINEALREGPLTPAVKRTWE